MSCASTPSLAANPGATPTGNVNNTIDSALVSASASGNTGTINAGAQNVPLQSAANVAVPSISVAKTVTGPAGTCPGTETRTIDEGGSVKYCYVVTNSGEANLFDVVLKDDNGTPANTADDFFVTLTGLTNEDSDGLNDDLAPGATATGTAIRSFDASGTVTNTATAIGEDATDGQYTDEDTATVTISGVAPSITVDKSAAPGSLPEPGGTATFTVRIDNTSSATDPVTIDTLTDDIYGDLNGEGDCSVPQIIQPGGYYECSFEETVSGNAGSSHKNTVTASGADDEGSPVSDSDDATVTITNVDPKLSVTKTADPTSVPETGADVVFTFTVTNESDEAVTITSLSDSDFGTLAGDADCQVNTILAAAGQPGDSCSFTQTEPIDGDFGGLDHVNTFSATVVDDEGSTDTATDDATVTFTDVLPEVSVVKSANPTSVPETGANVDFTFTVTNDGDEAGTITSLSDSDFGTLTGDLDCKVGTVLDPGESCSFTITEFIDGDAAGPDHSNTVTVVLTDDDNNTDEGTDDETVEITNVLPEISVTKTADPTSVPETGADVEFTYTVTNGSAESVTITDLGDDVFTNVTGSDDCKIGTVLAPDGDPGDSCTFTITRFIEGDAGGADHVNTFSVTAEDNDGTSDTATDDATVTFSDVLPDITVDKVAVPSTVPETGGNVTYTVTVTNNSTEALTLDTLSDDKVDLSLVADCDITGVTLSPTGDPGDSFSCDYTEFVSGDEGTTLTNTATATASDDDGNSDEASDTADVTFSDVPVDISVEKTADPTSIPETGGQVTYTIVVSNENDEDVTITSLTDDKFADIDTECLDANDAVLVGQTVPAKDSLTCTFSTTLTGDAQGDPHVNVVTVVATDDDGGSDTATDDATVGFSDVLPEISVTKTADPTSVPETGADVEFTYTVTNGSAESVTITDLGDDVFTNVTGSDDCKIGTVLAPDGDPGDSCTFTITRFIEGDAGGADHVNTFSVTAEDNDGTSDTATDDATVTFSDVLPDITVDKVAVPSTVPETGGNVTYTVTVTNNSTEALTLDTLSDDKVDLSLVADCDITGVTLSPTGDPGDSFSCDYTEFVSGDEGTTLTNTATATASDDDGNSDEASDTADVTFSDVLPEVSVDKSANPTSVPETGANVDFTFTVTNDGDEAGTITSLSDSDFGTLAGDDDCKVGTVLDPGESCSFTITEFIDGDFGTDHSNTVTVVLTDDDDNTDEATDDETVELTDVLPEVSVVKSANPTSVPETGANVDFTFTVTNDGDEAGTITSLSDSDFGTLTGDLDCKVGTVLDPGESCSFTITEFIDGDAAGPDHSNTVTVVLTDDDNNTDEGTDDETVEITNVLPEISVTKTADPTSVPETGADVEFTYTVTNGSAESVTITDLGDDVFTNVTGSDDCKIGTVLAPDGDPGDSCTFTITRFIEGDAGGADHVNTFSVTAEDNDGTSDTATDDATVAFSDVLPEVSVDKSANPTSVPETGANVDFTFTVTNDGDEAGTITSLSDSDFGTLPVISTARSAPSWTQVSPAPSPSPSSSTATSARSLQYRHRGPDRRRRQHRRGHRRRDRRTHRRPPRGIPHQGRDA